MRARYMSLVLVSASALTLLAGKRLLSQPASPVPAAPDTPATSPAVEPVRNPESEAPPVFQEWIALGSGCRAGSDREGDITAERFTEREGGRVIHGIRFHLERLRLASAEQAPETALSFARECGIRVQVGPPSGRRIAGVSAATRVLSSKSERTKLTLIGTMNFGAVILRQGLVVYEAGAAHAHKESAFNLVPGAKPEEALPAMPCATGGLLGFTYSWIAERRSRSDEVAVEVAGDRTLELRAVLADCT